MLDRPSRTKISRSDPIKIKMHIYLGSFFFRINENGGSIFSAVIAASGKRFFAPSRKMSIVPDVWSTFFNFYPCPVI